MVSFGLIFRGLLADLQQAKTAQKDARLIAPRPLGKPQENRLPFPRTHAHAIGIRALFPAQLLPAA
ncbi:hypothetical protein BK140_13005 [Paenibacillus macerans]|nr:hypothetical protein BK140_13005 [Paenibacillus macerans]